MQNFLTDSQVKDELDRFQVALRLDGEPGLRPRLEECLLHLLGVPGFPKAFLTQAKRLADLCRKLQDGEADPSAVRSRMAEGLGKLLAGWPERLVVEEAPAPPAEVPGFESNASAAPVAELMGVFLQGQVDRLQEFEVLCLEREKGNPAAQARLLGLLHNLKGEYGVLDLAEWADLVHQVESALVEGRATTDQLLVLADLLGAQSDALAHGRNLSPTAEQRARIGLGAPVEEAIPAPPPAPAAPDEVIGASKAESDVSGGGSVAPWIQDPSFLADFQNESMEHIRAIEVALLRLETDAAAEDALHSAFRAYHTIKGLAAFLKLPRIRKLAHAAETMLDLVRKHELVLGPTHIDVLLVATDGLRGAITGLDATQGRAGRLEPDSLVASDVMEKLLHPETIDSNEPVSNLPDSSEPLGQTLVRTGRASESTIVKALGIQSQGDTRPLGEILVQDLNVRAMDVGHALGRQARVRHDRDPAPAAAAEPAAPVREPAKESAAVVEDSIRVPVDRLDQLIDAIGESVISQSMVFAHPRLVAVGDLALEKKMAQAATMLRRIQELSMSLRMVAIRQTFQKMSRLVRDLSRKQGKIVDLELEGEATELDKTVVENIGDPLVHMIRNSVDHGLESPEDRLGAGKSERGRIVLRAFHKAGSVHVEIEDDGRGLNRDRILAKAVAAGIAKPGQDLSDAEIHRLIFHPGLSTAEKVTDVSGRGVGMDVVKRNIETLRGTIDIRSVPGRGTCFTIRLPLTLAIIGGMSIRVGSERYIVPTLSVHATLRPSPEQLSTVTGRGEVLNLRGELLPLVRLHDQFDVAREREIHDGVVLVVEDAGGRRTGLVADEILDQQQVVVKSLGAGIDTRGLTGAAILNDGTVSLILDVAGIVRIAHEA